MVDLDYDPNDPNSLLKYLRLSNIFAPNLSNAAQDVTTDQTPNQSSSLIDINDVVKKLMSPNEEMFNRMKTQVDSMPHLADFKDPSIWTKIRAHLAGLGADNVIQAHSIRENIEHEPYLKALNEWKMQLEPTEKLTQFENTRNTNDRLTGASILRDEQANRRLDETARKNLEHEKDVDEDRKIRQQRADAYEFKTMHPEYKSATDASGKLVFYDPRDPTKIIRTEIDTGKMSDIDKINLQHEGRMEEIQERGKVSSKLEGERNVNRQGIENLRFGHRQTLEETKEENTIKNEAIRQGNRVALKQTPSGSGTATNPKPKSDTQKKQELINKANAVISANPELRNYVIFDKNGVHIAPSGIFGSEEKRMKAYNLIFKEEPVPGFAGSSSNKNVTPESSSSNKIRVRRKADGQTGTIDAKDFNPEKYEKVQ